MDKLHLWVWRT